MQMRFEKKTAVVTGGSQGIGFAMAQLFAAEGASVYILDIDTTHGEDAQQSLQRMYGTGTFLRCDITNEAELNVVAKAIKEKVVHVLCNNAGLELSKNVEETTIHEWRKVCDVNLMGPFLVTKVLLPLLEAANGASIVNTSSISGIIGWPDSTAYCSTKGGVITLTKQLACDLACKHIRVNCICPGTTRTPMIQRLIGDGPDAEEQARKIAEMHLLKRFAEPTEIAQAALFLASEDASFVTGAILPVDGGYTAK